MVYHINDHCILKLLVLHIFGHNTSVCLSACVFTNFEPASNIWSIEDTVLIYGVRISRIITFSGQQHQSWGHAPVTPDDPAASNCFTNTSFVTHYVKILSITFSWWRLPGVTSLCNIYAAAIYPFLEFDFLLFLQYSKTLIKWPPMELKKMFVTSEVEGWSH